MARAYRHSASCPCSGCRAAAQPVALPPSTGRARQTLAAVVFSLAAIGAADVVRIIL